jgi:hypothetical protein
MDSPVVIGKLYLGVEAEKADPRGTLNVVDSKVSNSAEIPFDTKLGSQVADNVANTNVPFSSLERISNALSTAEVNIAQNDRDYGNRFKQVISDTNGKFSTFEQDINGFKTTVGNKFENIDGTIADHESKITQNSDGIALEVTNRTQAIKDNYDLVTKEYEAAIKITDTRITTEVSTLNSTITDTGETVLEAAKAHTDTTAQGITSTVTDLTETVSELGTTVSENYSTLDLKADSISAEVGTKLSTNSEAVEKNLG